jgi:UV DNA damage endonuclease
LLSVSGIERRRILRELYRDNIEVLRRALRFCDARALRLYRLTSSLFPFSDEPYGMRVLDTFHRPLREAGRMAQELGIRMVVHPDQYVVLNSDSEHVIHNSIKILTAQAHVLDALEQPRTPWAAIQLHGGKAGRGPKLIEVVRTLEAGIRERLAFENDEYAFGAQDILDICAAARVPMVFDAHHHLVHDQLPSYDHPSIGRYLAAAARTWPRPEWQLVHISNGRAALTDQTHSDFITRWPSAYWQVPYIEVEAKAKEQAIDRIRARWKRGAWRQAAAARLTA